MGNNQLLSPHDNDNLHVPTNTVQKKGNLKPNLHFNKKGSSQQVSAAEKHGGQSILSLAQVQVNQAGQTSTLPSIVNVDGFTNPASDEPTLTLHGIFMK